MYHNWTFHGASVDKAHFTAKSAKDLRGAWPITADVQQRKYLLIQKKIYKGQSWKTKTFAEMFVLANDQQLHIYTSSSPEATLPC